VGWTRQGVWGTSGTTRSTISPGPGGYPRRQLVGTPDRTTLDLKRARRDGPSKLVGRWAAVRDGRARCSPAACATSPSLADLKMERLLDTFDEWASDSWLRRRGRPSRALSRRHRWPESARACSSTCEAARSARSSGRRVFSAPTTDGSTCPWPTRRAKLRHEGAGRFVDSPGLYALGLPVLRRARKSTFHPRHLRRRPVEVIDHLTRYLAVRRVIWSFNAAATLPRVAQGGSGALPGYCSIAAGARVLDRLDSVIRFRGTGATPPSLIVRMPTTPPSEGTPPAQKGGRPCASDPFRS